MLASVAAGELRTALAFCWSHPWISLALLLLFRLAWQVAHEWRYGGAKPSLRFLPTAFNRAIVHQLGQLHVPFHPTPLLSGHFIQSAISNFLRWSPRLRYDREILTMRSDGEHIALDWWPNRPPSLADSQQHKPVVIIMHGISGNSRELNVQILCQHLSDRHGYRCVVFNRRGCADGLELRHPKPYAYGDTGDFGEVVDHIVASLPPSTPLLAVGLSAGSNPLVRYLGEQGEKSKIVAAISAANAFDLEQCAVRLSKRPFFDFWMTRALRDHVFERHMHTYRAKLPSHLTVSSHVRAIRRARSVLEFDRLFAAQLHGFTDSRKYFRSQGSLDAVERVRVPLLVLNALDDPIVHHSLIPFDVAARNPHVLLVTTHRGGHLGWMHRDSLLGASWMDTLAGDFLACSLQLRHLLAPHEPAAAHVPAHPGSDMSVLEEVHQQSKRAAAQWRQITARHHHPHAVAYEPGQEFDVFLAKHHRDSDHKLNDSAAYAASGSRHDPQRASAADPHPQPHARRRSTRSIPMPHGHKRSRARSNDRHKARTAAAADESSRPPTKRAKQATAVHAELKRKAPPVASARARSRSRSRSGTTSTPQQAEASAAKRQKIEQ